MSISEFGKENKLDLSGGVGQTNGILLFMNKKSCKISACPWKLIMSKQEECVMERAEYELSRVFAHYEVTSRLGIEH